MYAHCTIHLQCSVWHCTVLYCIVLYRIVYNQYEDASSLDMSLQEAERAKALAVLLVMHFHPATQNRPRLRQCLSVFFPTFAMASAANKHDIARAFRRAARGALRAGPLKKSPAPQLMRYMLHLLHLTSTTQQTTRADVDEDAAESAQQQGSRYSCQVHMSKLSQSHYMQNYKAADTCCLK